MHRPFFLKKSKVSASSCQERSLPSSSGCLSWQIPLLCDPIRDKDPLSLKPKGSFRGRYGSFPSPFQMSFWTLLFFFFSPPHCTGVFLPEEPFPLPPPNSDPLFCFFLRLAPHSLSPNAAFRVSLNYPTTDLPFIRFDSDYERSSLRASPSTQPQQAFSPCGASGNFPPTVWYLPRDFLFMKRPSSHSPTEGSSVDTFLPSSSTADHAGVFSLFVEPFVEKVRRRRCPSAIGLFPSRILFKPPTH